MQETTLLKLNELTKSFDNRSIPALNNLSLNVHQGEVISLFGPSGTGKSTLLKILAGQVAADSGDFESQGLVELVIDFDQVDFNKSVSDILSERILNLSPEEQVERKRQLIEMFSLFYKDQKKFQELSLGEQKRVLIARSLAPRPTILLLDEPFSSLDLIVKNEIQNELKEIFQSTKMACLFVTHNFQDVLSFSNRVAIIDHGEFRQVDTPQEVYNNPRDAHVAKLIDLAFCLPCETIGLEGDNLIIKSSFGEFNLKNQLEQFCNIGQKSNLLVWPEEWLLGNIKEDYLVLKAKVLDCIPAGAAQKVLMEYQNRRFVVQVSNLDKIKKGDPLHISFNPDLVRLIAL